MSTYSQVIAGRQSILSLKSESSYLKEVSLGNSRLQTLKCFMISVFVIAVMCIGSSIIVNADTGVEQVKSRYYTSICIEENDTLWDIAARYNSGEENRDTYINSIMKLNNMNSDVLYSGQNLIIYYYVDEVD